jgi:hypothetical protein
VQTGFNGGTANSFSNLGKIVVISGGYFEVDSSSGGTFQGSVLNSGNITIAGGTASIDSLCYRNQGTVMVPSPFPLPPVRQAAVVMKVTQAATCGHHRPQDLYLNPQPVRLTLSCITSVAVHEFPVQTPVVPRYHPPQGLIYLSRLPSWPIRLISSALY